MFKNLKKYTLCLKLKIYTFFKIFNTSSTLKNLEKLFNKTSLNFEEDFDADWKATVCSDWVIFVLVVHPLTLISFCGDADCPPSQ